MNAAIKTFNVTWSGVPYSNNAAATGTLTFDDTALATGGTCSGLGSGAGQCNVSQMNITVTGASSGNGNYTISNFNNLYMRATNSGALNTSIQLYNQIGSNSVAWAVNSGDNFNVIGTSINGVNDGGYFTIQVGGIGGNRLRMTSMIVSSPPTAQAVPSLSEWSQLMLGLMVLTMLGWQWRKQQS